MDYKTAGVDVQAGRAFIERIRSSVEATHRPEVIGGLGGFGGLIRLPAGLNKPLLVAGTDGVGTKLELAQQHQAHYGVGLRPWHKLWRELQRAVAAAAAPS